MPLDLTIVTPDAEALSLQCEEVAAPGINGEIGFLSGHVPVVTALCPGLLTVIAEGKKSYYAVSTGFAELEGEKLTVLTEDCEAAPKVDVERAKQDAEKAEKALADLGEDDADYPVYRRRLERAQARLLAASLV